MDFIINLLISADWKGDSYNSILVIIDRLTKIVYYEPIKVTINTSGLAEVIFNMFVCHNKVREFIVMDQGLLFISKF